MAIHSRVYHNGRIRGSSETLLSPGQLGLLAGWGVFTTLRVKDGALFAWDRHWSRMCRDAAGIHLEMPSDPDSLYRDLVGLVEANGRENCTMRLVIVRNTGGMGEAATSGTAIDVIAMTAESKSWGDSVRLDIQPNGRFAAGEFAGAKLNSWAQNLTWAERAHRRGFDETVLLNERGTVAECTSANIFAVCGAEVRTPPLSDGCLPGITREVLLGEVSVPGIQVVESSLTLDDLYGADDVFITSTTRDLLTVREIAGIELKMQGDVRSKLCAAFREFVQGDAAARVQQENLRCL